MLILLNMMQAIAYILDTLITLTLVVVFARVILSWIRLPYNAIIHVIYQVTEPILSPIRRRLPYARGIDFSPIIVFLVLIVLRLVVVASIYDYVALYRMRYLQGL